MQRFGRAAQHKMKDRWGGGFILATILALLAAWAGGIQLSNYLSGTNTASVPTPPSVTQNTDGIGGVMTVEPHQFDLYFMQVGAFRSQAGAERMARTLGEEALPSMVAPRNEQGLYRVFAGVYTSPEVAEEAKEDLLATGVEGVYPVTIHVDHNPGAVPASTGSNADVDMKKGLALLNTYLWEVAYWLENRAVDMPTDTSGIAGLGQQLGDYVTTMGTETDSTVKQFVDMAAAANANATEIKAATTATSSSDQFQVAMTGYLTVLDQYRSFHAGK